MSAWLVLLLGLKVHILGYWWENPIPAQQVPKGLTSLSARQCGGCHREIYEEWRGSAHAQALSDLQFQAELKKSPETNWLCLNCHTPLENQLSSIAVGVHNGSPHQPVTRSNARFDPALRDEAITCAVCHVRDGVVLGPYGDSAAPHPVRKDPRLLTETLCTMCHQATAAYTDTLVCTFDTGLEWKSGPYARSGQSCSGCHMPAVERPIAAGGRPRAARRHLFLGSRIPKTLALTAAERKKYEAFRPGLAVEIARIRRSGPRVLVTLKLRNAYAGHMLPTGDPERFIRVEATLLAGGKPLQTKTLRIGQHWEWFPKARKLGDNRLKPLEERLETIEFQAPRPPAGLQVIVFNGRLTEQNARYHDLIGRYPLEAEVLRLPPVALYP